MDVNLEVIVLGDVVAVAVVGGGGGGGGVFGVLTIAWNATNALYELSSLCFCVVLVLVLAEH